MKYHHLGIPTTEIHADDVHHPHLKLYSRGYDQDDFHIEWVRFEENAPYPEQVKRLPHVAFEVDDLEQALVGRHVLIEPNSPSAGVKVAFIEVNGAPVELIQVDRTIAQKGI